MRGRTKQIGEVVEAAVLAAFVEAGFTVSLPFGENAAYDMVVDSGDGRLARVQVKASRRVGGCLVFGTQASNSTGTRMYYGEADLFATLDRSTSRVYVVPVEGSARSMQSLRIVPAKNGQTDRVRYASDYLFTGTPLQW